MHVADKYYPDVKNFAGNNFSLVHNSKKAIGVMLYGFATGQGIRDYKFDSETKVSYDFFYGDEETGGRNIAAEIEEKLYLFINAEKISLKDLQQGYKTNIPLLFSPDQTSSMESFDKHVKSNSIQFFTGGAIARITIIEKTVFISVYNETSRSSFFAHGKFGLSWAAQNVKRQSPDSEGPPLSTITQTFETFLNLNEAKIKNK